MDSSQNKKYFKIDTNGIWFFSKQIVLSNGSVIGRHFSTPETRSLTQSLEARLNNGQQVESGNLKLCSSNQESVMQLFIDIYNICGEFRGVTEDTLRNLLTKKYGVSTEKVDQIQTNGSPYIEKLDWGENLIYIPRNMPVSEYFS
jgi:hypothetical protein